jgi:hypothetical protein
MRTVRIGSGAGFWGDTPTAPAQLVRQGGVDYLVFDYLAEVTMSLLARARSRSPDLGYATDFVDPVMKDILVDVLENNIKVISNAGGVNPEACQDALQRLASEAGLEINIALVKGDDLMPRLKELADVDKTEMFSGEPFPENIQSLSVYLGGRPIAEALDGGAQIVITGKCADSAVVLGPLMHEFGWKDSDYDFLAAGSLAGHIIECGAQATGGNFTDWQLSSAGWHDIGFPFVDFQEDGTFTVSKPEGTGGLVSTATVSEQMLYELGDPAHYILPDVVCDFRQVSLEQMGPDSVRVTGAKGLGATSTYKVNATHMDGYRATALFMIGGIDAKYKGDAVAEAILKRTGKLFRKKNFGDYRGTDVEVIGAEATYGVHARAHATREVMVKIAVHHDVREAVDIFAREIAPAVTGMAPGVTGIFGGRPRISPVVRLHSFLIKKSFVPSMVQIGDQFKEIPAHLPSELLKSADLLTSIEYDNEPCNVQSTVPVRLIKLAYARSGDKGNSANIGVIAREAEFLPVLREKLTANVLAAYFTHLVEGEVTRYELPGINAFNFMLDGALDGGGVASLRMDPQAKAFAQMLLDIEVHVPETLAVAHGLI